MRIDKDLGAEKVFTVSGFQEKSERKGDCESHPRLTGLVLLQAKGAGIGQPSLELDPGHDLLSLLGPGVWITVCQRRDPGPGIQLDESDNAVFQLAHR